MNSYNDLCPFYKTPLFFGISRQTAWTDGLSDRREKKKKHRAREHNLAHKMREIRKGERGKENKRKWKNESRGKVRKKK